MRGTGVDVQHGQRAASLRRARRPRYDVWWGWRVTTDFGGDEYAAAVAIQSDGKVVAASNVHTSPSSGDFALARYNTNGTLDDTFNGTGKVTTDFFGGYDSARAVAIQSDGKIVAGG